MSSVFFARSLTRGRTAAGILCEAVVISGERLLCGEQMFGYGFQPLSIDVHSSLILLLTIVEVLPRVSAAKLQLS